MPPFEVAGAGGGGFRSTMADALFHPDGDRFVPDASARGPWSPDALHGGPVAALVARQVERCDPVEGLQAARFTIELMRLVPFAPLSVEAAVVRPGRRSRLLEAVLRSGDTELAVARALQMRTADLRLPAAAEQSLASVPAPPGGPLEGRAKVIRHGGGGPLFGSDRAFGSHGAELRVVEPAPGPGVSATWVRLRVPVVPGEPPSPLQRLVAAADFGNGVSSVLEFGSWLFINADLSVHVHRLPRGEWICLVAQSLVQPHGIGIADTVLHDEDGPIARSVQTLLVDRLDG